MSKKLVNGVVMDMTPQELQEFEERNALWEAGAFDRAIKDLRLDRDNLLAETDYLALSDQTMSAEMTAYRQALRDITNGLTTVADVEAVVFPTKPEA